MTKERRSDPAFEERLGWVILGFALIIGIGLRGWIAVHDQGTYWADEIYQSLEPAHRLAFGYGLLPWEYLEGARTWVFPGLVAGLMKLTDWIGLDAPWQYLGVIRAVLVANAAATIAGTYLLARRLAARPVPAALAALLLALWPTAIYFSFRAFSEVATSGQVVFGLWLLLDRRDEQTNLLHSGSVSLDVARDKIARPTPGVSPAAWRDWLAIGLLTLATAMRLQNLIFLVGGVALPFSFGQWRRGGRVVVAALIGLLTIGFLDWLTWGSWFHSIQTYLAFNATGASGWGVAAFDYYWTTIQQSLGWAWIPLAGLVLLSLRRGWRIAIIVAVFIAAHANVPHKELRFIYPSFALLASMVGIGIGEIWDLIERLNTRRVTSYASLTSEVGGSETFEVSPARVALMVAMLSLILWIGRSPFQISRADVDLKVIDAVADQTTAYGQYDSENRLLWAAYQQTDLCGLGIDVFPVSTGGYSYLHRNVPLYENTGPHDQTQIYNYKITTLGDDSVGTIVTTIGGRKLVRLSNRTCQSDPGYRSPRL